MHVGSILTLKLIQGQGQKIKGQGQSCNYEKMLSPINPERKVESK